LIILEDLLDIIQFLMELKGMLFLLQKSLVHNHIEHQVTRNLSVFLL
jgi:hypothetical protein